MDEQGKIFRILNDMIGRRTNHDILIMADRYLGKKLSQSEYDYLLERTKVDGVEADGIFYEDYCLDADAYQRLLEDKKRFKKQMKFRKNKQKQSKGKPKKK